MSRHPPNIVDAARRLMEVTARAWKIRPESAHALARRAPHGYVPRRLAHRLRVAGEAQVGRAQPVQARA